MYAFHSIVLRSAMTPTFLRSCWMSAFTGSSTPRCPTSIVNWNGLPSFCRTPFAPGVQPAAARSSLAFGGAYRDFSDSDGAKYALSAGGYGRVGTRPVAEPHG